MTEPVSVPQHPAPEKSAAPLVGLRFEGRVALVTGGAAGIGTAIAARLAREGARVVIVDRNADAGETVSALLREQGCDVLALTADVSRGQDVTRVFRDVEHHFGRLDILVNNAGINVRGDFRHMSDGDWERIREVNLDGVVRMARDGFELLRRSPHACLINVSSIMGARGLRQLAGYSATKGAVTALTKALAVEYAPFGIRVNTVSPGFVETALTERLLKMPALAKALVDKTPLRRFGTGEDVAAAVAFLASDDAAFITGAELVVDGGMSAQL